jgi:hypothetical protein
MTRDDLERRRAQHEAQHLLAQLRTLLDLIDSGELDLDHGACLIHRAAGRLAGLALNGDLVAA